jgi:hypothetical protein
MARYQSKAQLEEIEYSSFFKRVYPEIEAQMKAFVASYDDSAPVEEDMKVIANSPMALMRRRMAKYCVWPAARMIETSVNFRSRLVTESMEKFCKPMQAEYDAKKRTEEKARREAFKAAAQSREIVEEGMCRQSSDLGEFVMFPKQARVLTCISCEFFRAPRDMGQDDDGYYCKFALPTEEEQATPRYQEVLKAMHRDIEYEANEKARIEERRKANLAEMRSRGVEPDWLDEIFAADNS